MYTTCYLVINKKGAVKAKKYKPTTASNEIAFKIVLDIPQQVFEKPQFEATLRIDPKNISAPVITPDIQDNITKILQQNLGVKVNFTIDRVDDLEGKLKAIDSMGDNE